MAGDPNAIVKAGKMSNGQIAGRSGPETLPCAPKPQSSLDEAQYGSKAGVLKKGK